MKSLKKKYLFKNRWDYENGFYLTSGLDRLSKLLDHYDVFNQIKNIKGDILEFGVFKGSSLVRFLSFMHLINSNKRIHAFDVFGKFPKQDRDDDVNFIKRFEKASGDGISKEDLLFFLKKKFNDVSNLNLIKGDIVKTLPKFIKKNPNKKFSLINLDVDVYEPTKVILENIYNKLSPNGVIIFDDYNSVKGETDAVDNFFKSRGIKLKLKKTKYTNLPKIYIKQP